MKNRKGIIVFLAVLLMLSAFALAACGNETDPPEPVKPSITGPTEMTLTARYEATSTGVYTVAGDDVTVTKTSGSPRITWNNDTKKLDIAAGASAGEYPVVLKASNGNADEDATITFTLTVEPFLTPSLSGETAYNKTVGYEAFSTTAYTVTGTNVNVAFTDVNSGGKITWNDSEKKLYIAAGLEKGSYTATLKASSGTVSEDKTLTFMLLIKEPVISGAISPIGYVELGVEATATFKIESTEFAAADITKVYLDSDFMNESSIASVNTTTGVATINKTELNSLTSNKPTGIKTIIICVEKDSVVTRYSADVEFVTYAINNEDEFFNLYYNGASVEWNQLLVLTADLDMIGRPMATGRSGKYFKGTFDGKGHTIANLTSNHAHGLLGWDNDSAASAALKNIAFVNAVNNMTSGFLAQQLPGAVFENIFIQGQATVSDNRTAPFAANENNLHGLLGYNSVANTKCTFNNVMAIWNYTGTVITDQTDGFTGESRTTDSCTGVFARTGELEVSNVLAVSNKLTGLVRNDTKINGVVSKGSEYVYSSLDTLIGADLDLSAWTQANASLPESKGWNITKGYPILQGVLDWYDGFADENVEVAQGFSKQLPTTGDDVFEVKSGGGNGVTVTVGGYITVEVDATERNDLIIEATSAFNGAARTYTVSIVYSDEGKCDVSFEKNGGEGTADDKTVITTAQYGTLPTVAKTDNDFKGWWTKDGSVDGDWGTQVIETTVVTSENDHTLYARWFDTAKSSLDFSNPNDLDYMTSVYGYYGQNESVGLKKEIVDRDGKEWLQLENTRTGDSQRDAVLILYMPFVTGSRISITVDVDFGATTATNYGVRFIGVNAGQSGWNTNMLFDTRYVDTMLSGTGQRTLVSNAIGSDTAGFIALTLYFGPGGITKADFSKIKIYITDITIVDPGTEFEVSFEKNGGEGTANVKNVAMDTAYGTLPELTKGTDTFAGWWTKDGAGDDWGTQVTASTVMTTYSNHTLYARYTSAPTYTVSFEKNGGSGDSEPIDVKTGLVYGTLPTVTKTDNEFKGWWTKDGTSDADWGVQITATTEVVAEASHTLYARWFDMAKNSLDFSNPNDADYFTEYTPSYGQLQYTVVDRSENESGEYWLQAKMTNSTHARKILAIGFKFNIKKGEIVEFDLDFAYSALLGVEPSKNNNAADFPTNSIKVTIDMNGGWSNEWNAKNTAVENKWPAGGTKVKYTAWADGTVYMNVQLHNDMNLSEFYCYIDNLRIIPISQALDFSGANDLDYLNPIFNGWESTPGIGYDIVDKDGDGKLWLATKGIRTGENNGVLSVLLPVANGSRIQFKVAVDYGTSTTETFSINVRGVTVKGWDTSWNATPLQDDNLANQSNIVSSGGIYTSKATTADIAAFGFNFTYGSKSDAGWHDITIYITDIEILPAA